MTKDQVLSTIDTKIRLKSGDVHFINDASRCIRDALELKLTKSEREQVTNLKNELSKIQSPHHLQFNIIDNMPILDILIELQSILED